MANYNNGKYIAEAIESVISQTYPLWELIIVDDCSTDKSVEIIKSFLKDSRIKLINHHNNLGYGGSLQTAANHATNSIFGILDPDDKLHEKAIEVMVNAYLKNHDYGFIYSNCWVCDSNMRNCVVSEDLGTISEDRIFFKEVISHFKTFRREAYLKTSGFDINQKRAVDKDLILKLEEVTKIKFINKPLYYYRSHEGGISQGKNQKKAILYFYIAKCKAYRRRLNTNIPNCTIDELYFEYLNLTFTSLINFSKKAYKSLKIPYLTKKYEKLYQRVKNLIINKTRTILKRYR